MFQTTKITSGTLVLHLENPMVAGGKLTCLPFYGLESLVVLGTESPIRIKDRGAILAVRNDEGLSIRLIRLNHDLDTFDVDSAVPSVKGFSHNRGEDVTNIIAIESGTDISSRLGLKDLVNLISNNYGFSD